ncbi:MAG: serine dehydratase subunit alpha family protein [Tissierellia bacterium]|nr:serine dehydratase subunit alpha family protein [Tissierellia bacterium]
MGINEQMDILVQMVRQDSIPALGCTEPVAVAYAAAVANKYITADIDDMEIIVSKNIYKNGKSVIIPNTNEWGLDLAGALGLLGGNSEDGFMVLKNIDKDTIEGARNMIQGGKVHVKYLDNSPDIYVYIKANSPKERVEVELRDNHTYIDRIKVNGETVYRGHLVIEESTSTDFLKEMTFKEIRQICQMVDLEELAFIEEGIEMNKRAAEMGMRDDKGLGIGRAYKKMQREGKLSNDAATQARILTAASADMRMSGGDCPIMTSAGSGNQGLGVILPLVVVAEEHKVEREKLIRAIFFAHIINKYVKIHTGKLSAMCGCAIAAGIGASAGISWILGGDDEEIQGACQNMLSNLTGMICDGAKETCALKLSTSAGETVLSAYLAQEGVIVRSNVGIIGDSIEETIKNVGLLCREGLIHADSVIVDMIQ